MPRPKLPPAQTDATILCQMLEAEDFVSGSVLAETINTSRVSIWGHLDKLRKEGFEFEAIRNRGYRIEKLPQDLHSSLLQAYLNQLNVSAPLVFLEETDSTNSEAERQIATDIETPAIIIAKKQTHGRGRQGRKWESSDKGNLHCSFAFKPNLSPSHMQTFSLWIGLCVCDLIKTKYELPIQIKWPNDLVISGKKVSGFLAEARIDADHTRDFVFGIGLNINGEPKNWPAEIQNTATSLRAHSKDTYNINAFTAEFIQCILNAYEQFIAGTYKNDLQTLWKTYDSLSEKTVTAYRGTSTLAGKAMGIDENGYLKLLLDDGTLQVLNNAEVSLTHKTS